MCKIDCSITKNLSDSNNNLLKFQVGGFDNSFEPSASNPLKQAILLPVSGQLLLAITLPKLKCLARAS